jgi:hypothetical protein
MADLSVIISESLTLNGIQQGSSKSVNIGDCTDAFTRIVTCTSGQTTTIVQYNDDVEAAGSTMDIQGTKYFRVTNLDGSNFITLNILIDVGEDYSGADNIVSLRVNPHQSFIMGTAHDSISVDDDGTTAVALNDVQSISVTPDTAAVKVEVFQAGTIA